MECVAGGLLENNDHCLLYGSLSETEILVPLRYLKPPPPRSASIGAPVLSCPLSARLGYKRPPTGNRSPLDALAFAPAWLHLHMQ